MTANTLKTRMMTLGFQMAEMGRQQAFEAEARNQGDYDGARMYAKRAEMYRLATVTLKSEIDVEIDSLYDKT